MTINEMKNSKVFKDLYELDDIYRDERRHYDELKEAKREELSSDAFWDWYKQNDAPEYPLSNGECKALREVIWCETDELLLEDTLWESEVHDYISTLRDMGAETIVITSESTGLMENMHLFAAEGLRLVGLCEVETSRKDYRTKKPLVRKGVRFAF